MSVAEQRQGLLVLGLGTVIGNVAGQHHGIHGGGQAIEEPDDLPRPMTCPLAAVQVEVADVGKDYHPASMSESWPDTSSWRSTCVP